MKKVLQEHLEFFREETRMYPFLFTATWVSVAILFAMIPVGAILGHLQ